MRKSDSVGSHKSPSASSIISHARRTRWHYQSVTWFHAVTGDGTFRLCPRGWHPIHAMHYRGRRVAGPGCRGKLRESVIPQCAADSSQDEASPRRPETWPVSVGEIDAVLCSWPNRRGSKARVEQEWNAHKWTGSVREET